MRLGRSTGFWLFCVVVLTSNCSGEVEVRAESSAATQASSTEEAMPFGLRMGMTKAQVGAKEMATLPGMYKLSTVPKPHSDFDVYLLQFGPTTGLCYVQAVGKTLTTNVYGIQLKAEFTKIRDQMALTYGKSTDEDFLMPDSIWNELQDWTMGLIKGERVLFSKWDQDSGATLRLHLRNVALIAYALSSNRGFVSIEYYFDNEKQCQKELDAVSGSVL